MKKEYKAAELEVLYCEAEDIVTVSGMPDLPVEGGQG